MWKRLWIRLLMLCLTLSLALTGCGDTPPDSSVDASVGDTTTTTTTTTTKVTTPSTTVVFDWKDEGDTIANPAGSDDPVAKYTTTFDESTGTLTVSGKGRLKDLYPRKWEHPGIGFGKISEFINADYEVQRLVIGEGITYLENCFNDMMALEEIIFPSTLKTIECSFVACEALEELTVPATVGRIWHRSFLYCSKLKRIDFQGRIKLTCPGSFKYLDALEEVSIPADSELCDSFTKCENLKTVTLGASVFCHSPCYEADGGPCDFSFWGCPVIEKVYVYEPVFERKAGFSVTLRKNGGGYYIEPTEIYEGIGVNDEKFVLVK